MSLDTIKKQELINAHQTHGTDTGSVEVQVEGSKERLTRFEDNLRRGPASGRVEALERIAPIPDDPWADFEIRFG